MRNDPNTFARFKAKKKLPAVRYVLNFESRATGNEYFFEVGL